jgi:addiction module HigA family antidote
LIVSYRDRRTADFAAGQRVKALSGIERPARLKLDRLEAAHTLKDLAPLPGNRFEALKGDRIGERNTNTMARIALHPGEHLAEELGALEMSAAELARRLKVPTNRVTGILNGQRAITGDTALRLAHFFGTSAEFWLSLQALYDLRVAEAKAGRAIKKLPTLKHREQVHA